MSKQRQALSSKKIMDLTNNSLFGRTKSPTFREDKDARSDASPQRSASPVLDEVDINNIGQRDDIPLRTSDLFSLLNVKDNPDGPRQLRTEDRRTVFKMKDQFQLEENQNNMKTPYQDMMEDGNPDLDFSSK